MQLLTAVNLVLPALGEHPVTNVNIKHPTLAILLPIIDTKLDEMLQRGWWFNKFRTTLYQDSEGEIAVPANCLQFLPDSHGIVSGSRLFNDQTLTYKWDGPVPGVIRLRIPFENLPETAATYVFYKALVQAYMTDIGLEQVLREWQVVRDEAERALSAEHLRYARHTTKKSRAYANIRHHMRG